MRIILNEDIDNLGSRGDVKDVAAGYARNYLLPKGFAYRETKANLARFQHEQKAWEERAERADKAAKELRDALNGLHIKILRKAGEEGVLFGAVTSSDIAAGLATLGHKIDKRKINLADPIKRQGDHRVEVGIFKDIKAELIVEVSPEV